MTDAKLGGHRGGGRIVLCGLAVISLFIAACSGGGNESPILPTAPAPGPGSSLIHCDQTEVVRSAAAARQAALPAPQATTVATDFATCLAHGPNVEVGGPNCPSPVVVQKSATAGTITVDAGATLQLGDTT